MFLGAFRRLPPGLRRAPPWRASPAGRARWAAV